MGVVRVVKHQDIEGVVRVVKHQDIEVEVRVVKHQDIEGGSSCGQAPGHRGRSSCGQAPGHRGRSSFLCLIGQRREPTVQHAGFYPRNQTLDCSVSCHLYSLQTLYFHLHIVLKASSWSFARDMAVT